MENMSRPKVLIAVPHHPAESKQYCSGVFMPSLYGIVGATKTADVEVVIRFDPNPIYGDTNNVKKMREWFRRIALDDNFDFLFFHGHDVQPPADVLDRLLAHGKDIVGGVYCRRPTGGDGDTDPSAIAWIERVSTEEKNILLNSPGPLIEVTGMGLDCVLISRAALEQIGWMDWEVNDDDWPWCKVMAEAGIPIYIDPSIQCKHFFADGSYAFRGGFFRA